MTTPSEAERATALALRVRVFVEEQGVPPELEVDAHDATADHIVLMRVGEALATGRVRLVPAGETPLAPNPRQIASETEASRAPLAWRGAEAPALASATPLAKVERVAVSRAHRRMGLGRAIMAALEARGREGGAEGFILAAQVSALPFYTRLGYEIFGAPFVDAGIDHRWMWRPA